MKPKPVKTVDELLEYLSQHKGKEVVAAWEGIEKEIYVYLDSSGRVILDCDDCNYQISYQGLKCDYCNRAGNYYNESGLVSCYACAKRFQH